ncbi:MAG: 4-hydroxy-2-oxoheptanedioate aldolase [Candidimonas sp.]|nr:4-hydroxy-2-oxoheptanedioate aldolase [Candidimonas sp.]
MSGNTFKLALARGESQIGLWLAMADSYSAQMLGGAGFDWLLIDGEHAPNTLPSILAQLQALAQYPTHAVVRAAWNDPVEIKRLLDIGVVNLLVPMVQDAKEAAMAVAATRYPPQGIRGVGAALARASEWNRNADYLASAADGMCVLVQAETRRALANLDDICKVDGVDGVFIGPADLAADMGYLGKPGHPDVQQAIEEGIARIRSHGKAAGILTSDEPTAKHYIELGATFTAVGADTTLLIRSAEALATRFGRGLLRDGAQGSAEKGAVY